jgi:hypothetical protein
MRCILPVVEVAKTVVVLETWGRDATYQNTGKHGLRGRDSNPQPTD